MEDVVINVEGLKKAYRSGSISTPVLNGVQFHVLRGECVFLAGPSGSGKSTLLSILGCVLSPDAGVVEILGEMVTGLDRRQQARFRRERIGFVFQRFHLFHGLTACENVRVPLDLKGCPGKHAKAEAHRLLSAVGLSDKANSHVYQLSMGQRQRVALARALACDPELILADEPTASLDAESGLNAMRLLRELVNERGKTAVVVTHDSRIFEFADRVLHLDCGCIREITQGRRSESPSRMVQGA